MEASAAEKAKADTIATAAVVDNMVMMSSNKADIKAAPSMTSININMNDGDNKGVMIILFESTNSRSGGSCGAICGVQASELKDEGMSDLN
eukprot:6561582-Ditylum_brightwellii.AAC.1